MCTKGDHEQLRGWLLPGIVMLVVTSTLPAVNVPVTSVRIATLDELQGFTAGGFHFTQADLIKPT